MAGRQLHQLDVVQLSLKTVRRQLADITGKVFHSLIALGKKVCLRCTESVCSWFRALWCGPQLAGDRLRQKWQPVHCRCDTASVLGYGLDAAGESPTAVSVTWLWRWLYVCSHGRWNVPRFAVQLQLWWYCTRWCPTLTRHIPVEVWPEFYSTVLGCMLDSSWSFSR